MQQTTTATTMHSTSGAGQRGRRRPALLALALAALGWHALPAQAQNLPVTPTQRATAEQVAQAGVPLSELAPNAPDLYVVKRGDTLWGISGIFLQRPWRWPELWGMNMAEVRNPHRIYPGQELVLEKSGGRATLRMRGVAGVGGLPGQPGDTIRVSPRTRTEGLIDSALPTLQTHLIEPFLAEPLIVDELALRQAPRIVATQEGRVLLSRGDRAYVRGQAGAQVSDARDQPQRFRVFRNATPLRDPITNVVLGYEAQYVGQAALVRGEASRTVTLANGKTETDPVPATIDIVGSKEEMRVGDRLLPEPARQFVSYTPHAPMSVIDGRIVSVYGSSVVNAAQSQVVVINRGTADGVETGHVFAILKDGEVLVDKTDAARQRIKLPDERNGLLMVFRPFDKLSYALILQITDGVKVGDRIANPR